MSAGQLVIVWALFAFALFGMPGFWAGWYFGRRCLRALLDPGRLPPVTEVRVVVEPPLHRAAPFPVDDTVPLLLLSEHAAAIAQTERDVRAMITDAERRFPGYGPTR